MLSKHGSTLGLMGGVLIMHLCWFHVFIMLVVHICLLHPCFFGHGGSGVAMEVLIVLSSTCYHEYMIGYLLLNIMYCSCILSYVFLHIVYAFLVYDRSHIGHACVFSVYACLCDGIYGICISRS